MLILVCRVYDEKGASILFARRTQSISNGRVERCHERRIAPQGNGLELWLGYGSYKIYDRGRTKMAPGMKGSSDQFSRDTPSHDVITSPIRTATNLAHETNT